MWAAIHFSFFSVENFSAKKMFGVAILAIILVGIGWEIFELSTGIPREENFVFDTTLDLIMDLIGACVGWWYTKNLFRKKMLVTEQNTELENTELELHEEI
jgi:glycopeptide antibiotics resistance protein